MVKRGNKYPRGKFNADDEGELAMKIGVKDKTVIMDFGKPVVWIGLGPQDAANLAGLLVRRAREAARDAGVVITIEI